MHYIQRHILDQLIRHKFRRNSEMRPEGVESNLYQYHLGRMLAEGYVVKTDDGYTLGFKGLEYADLHSISLMRAREQPKLVTILLIQNKAGDVLLQQRSKQPFIEQYNLPSGKIHKAESYLDAARRELNERLGQTVVADLTYHAMVHMMIMQGGEEVSEFYGMMARCRIEGDAPEGTVWSSAVEDEDHFLQLMPGVSELIALRDVPIGTFAEFIVQAD
jgi:8-oxo-dGTP pyrophosphatase MutT (NUDIX family)